MSDERPIPDWIFDLDAAIREWRQIAASKGISDLELEELEDHLRAALSSTAPQDREAAFASTLARLGSAEYLGRKYRRVREPRFTFLRWALLAPAAIAAAALAQVAGLWSGIRVVSWLGGGTIYSWEIAKVIAAVPMGFSFVLAARLMAPSGKKASAIGALAIVGVWSSLLLSTGASWIVLMAAAGLAGALTAFSLPFTSGLTISAR